MERLHASSTIPPINSPSPTPRATLYISRFTFHRLFAVPHARRSTLQALSSNLQALCSPLQAMSSNLQALCSNLQALSSNLHPLRSMLQALCSMLQALRSTFHALRSMLQALRLTLHTLRSPRPPRFPTMLSLPTTIRHIHAPPIKCQGIKTKLVPFIAQQIHWHETPAATWIEPFLGSGVVALNLCPERALLADANQHIIQFYQAIQRGEIDGQRVREFLRQEGSMLLAQGADYYYEVRSRFNTHHAPLDFLFLNRACFNGVMRFNRSGGFNVPFCRKPQRFAPSYITKIANQVDWAARQMQGKAWEFRVAPWQTTLSAAQPQDFVYLDPPYIGRHTDYYNAWDDQEATSLATRVQALPCRYALSMWLANQHRQNTHIPSHWAGVPMAVFQHFYHVGATENLRGAIAEALLLHPASSPAPPSSPPVIA